MLKESSEQLEGNNRYEGFGIELIDELAKLNEFNYTFEIQADGVYGSLDKNTGKWNGMMEKVMDGVIIVYIFWIKVIILGYLVYNSVMHLICLMSHVQIASLV